MKKNKLIHAPVFLLALFALNASAQTNPAITSWYINTSGLTGRHYISGSATPIIDATYPANVQSVAYNTTHAYISCSGIPAYIIGPYLDGNPNQGEDNDNIYRIPLSPVQNTGTPTATTSGTIGVFLNGVSLFDYRDGVSWKSSTSAEAGGPIPGGPGDGVWNRDAIVAEKSGFDCAKGHPAGTNYHHHQNPSAFNLDLSVISNICDTYLADGLYVIDSTVHSPLLGFAYDGFPIYGAYGYKNLDGTGGIVRIKSSYALRSMSARTHYADGTDVTDGPPINATYPLGRYREDYEYIPTSASTPDYLDEHNGRVCVTPEYPAGIYCYFTTVDDNWNSAYPYAVGPTFYGTKVVQLVTSLPGGLTTYTPSSVSEQVVLGFEMTIFPNPANAQVIVQCKNELQHNRRVDLISVEGKVIQTQTIFQGSTLCFFDTHTINAGTYMVKITSGNATETGRLVIVQ
ncbi:MAG TPA: YHYH protein [Flavobacteriales bacterium]|nr:YHYH protein [Flavobacteriales bacterium]